MAPPKIEQRTITVPLHCPKNRAFAPVATQQLTGRLDTYNLSSEDGQSHWRPRRNGQLAPPATSGWLETASVMERYVRSGESARDMADFALGEIEGSAQTLKANALGTARLIRHPVQCATQLGKAVMSSGPALSEFSKHSEEIVGGAIERKCSQFVNASNRERGRMTGAGLTQVGLTVAPMPKVTTVVSTSWKGLVRSLPKGALADRLGSLPGRFSKTGKLSGNSVGVHHGDGAGSAPIPGAPGGSSPREATGFLGRSGSDMVNFHGPNPPQNVKTTIKGLDYSGHSLDQMRNRGIMPSVVENTILHGSVSKGHSGNLVFSESINNMRVIMDSKLDTVVTAVKGVRKSSGQ